LVKDTLARWEGNWLLVFDNHDRPDELNIRRYFPMCMCICENLIAMLRANCISGAWLYHCYESSRGIARLRSIWIRSPKGLA
jgi:hypothetical protein